MVTSNQQKWSLNLTVYWMRYMKFKQDLLDMDGKRMETEGKVEHNEMDGNTIADWIKSMKLKQDLSNKEEKENED